MLYFLCFGVDYCMLNILKYFFIDGFYIFGKFNFLFLSLMMNKYILIFFFLSNLL